MTNPIIETDIAQILQELKSDQKEILKEVGNLRQDVNKEIGNLKQDINEVKLGQAKITGDIKALDTKVEQLNKRISNSELTNRGILIGLVVIILGGAAKLFGFMSN